MLLEQRTSQLLKADANAEDMEVMSSELRGWREIDNRFEQVFHRRLNEQNISEVLSNWATARQKFSELAK